MGSVFSIFGEFLNSWFYYDPERVNVTAVQHLVSEDNLERDGQEMEHALNMDHKKSEAENSDEYIEKLDDADTEWETGRRMYENADIAADMGITESHRNFMLDMYKIVDAWQEVENCFNRFTTHDLQVITELLIDILRYADKDGATCTEISNFATSHYGIDFELEATLRFFLPELVDLKPPVFVSELRADGEFAYKLILYDYPAVINGPRGVKIDLPQKNSPLPHERITQE